MGVKKLRSIFMRYIFTVAGGILFITALYQKIQPTPFGKKLLQMERI